MRIMMIRDNGCQTISNQGPDCQPSSMPEGPWRKLAIMIIIQAACLLGGAAPGFASPLVVNYENDENLAKAIDLTFGDRDKVSRPKAEEYYKKYLLQSKNNEQRARVLVILGCLYSSSARPKFGEPPDTAKASDYLKQAIAEDPDGVSWALLAARNHLICFPVDRKERLTAHLDFVEYLNNLSEEDIEKRCRPMTPNDDRKYTAKSTTQTMKGIKAAVQGNALAIAGGTPMPLVVEGDITSDLMLREIIRRFPNTAFAERAQSKLKEIAEARIAHDFDPLLRDDVLERTATPDAVSSMPTPGVAPRESVDAKRTYARKTAIVVGSAAVLVVATVLLLIRRRYSNNPRKKSV